MDANDPSLTQLMSRIERASLAYDAANNVVARKERAVLEKRRVLNLCLHDRLVLRKSMTEAVENENESHSAEANDAPSDAAKSYSSSSLPAKLQVKELSEEFTAQMREFNKAAAAMSRKEAEHRKDLEEFEAELATAATALEGAQAKKDELSTLLSDTLVARRDGTAAPSSSLVTDIDEKGPQKEMFGNPSNAIANLFSLWGLQGGASLPATTAASTAADRKTSSAALANGETSKESTDRDDDALLYLF